MNYKDFLNAKVVNKNNEEGVVLAFDKEHVVVKYSNDEKTYNPDVAFKTGFLFFENKQLQQLISDDLSIKEEIAKQAEEAQKESERKDLARRKKVNEEYKKLSIKNNILLSLFGADFEYPPFKDFEKKYKHLIVKKRTILDSYNWHGGYYW